MRGEGKRRENIVRAILRSFVFVNFDRIFYVLQHIMERRKKEGGGLVEGEEGEGRLDGGTVILRKCLYSLCERSYRRGGERGAGKMNRKKEEGIVRKNYENRVGDYYEVDR